MATIATCNTEIPQYHSGIIAQIESEIILPVTSTGSSIYTLIVNELIGTGQVRFGPRPNEATFDRLHRIVRANVQKNSPIPILVPSGPKKPHSGESIDLAELYAMRMMMCMHNRVSEVYPPGCKFYVRLEDLTGYALEAHEVEIRQDIEKYISDYQNLCNVLGYGQIIHPIRESMVTTESAYMNCVAQIFPVMADYLRYTDINGVGSAYHSDAYQELLRMGWIGVVPKEQRDFYKGKYERIYPDFPQSRINDLIAMYFSVTLARERVGLVILPKGMDKDFVQMNFAPQVPGIPEGFASNRVYYRAIPLSISKSNIPYWRAKGFLKLGQTVQPCLTTWADPTQFSKMTIHLDHPSNGIGVDIRADFIHAA